MPNAAQTERTQDKALEETFPASDPPANSGITGAATADKPAQNGETTSEPTGTPTSDRHATETAHHSEPDKPAPKSK